MNYYGSRAKELWERLDPARAAALENPEEFFEDLGEQVVTRIDEVCRSLEGTLPMDLGYLERVGQLNAIKKQAEEIVFAELVMIEYVPTGDEAEQWELAQLPSPRRVRHLLDNLEDRIEEMSTAEYELEKKRLHELLEKVSA